MVMAVGSMQGHAGYMSRTGCSLHMVPIKLLFMRAAKATGSCQLEFGGEGQVIYCAQLLNLFAANSEQLLGNRASGIIGL